MHEQVEQPGRPRRYRRALAAAVVLLAGSGATVDAAQASPPPPEPTVEVIVELAVPTLPETSLPEPGVQEQRRRIGAAADRLDDAFDGEVEHLTTAPVAFLEVPLSELDDLARHPDVASVQRDLRVRPTLTASTTLIGATSAWSSGSTGAGQTVAVLDTGVQANHPMLKDKVVAEACFSGSARYLDGICPGADPMEAIGPGAAAPCRATQGGCEHGTHVASIAVGKRPNSQAHGVAQDARLIAVQVFSLYTTRFGDGLTPPETSAESTVRDILRGLDWVYQQRTRYRIAAVNLSLGAEPVADGASCPTSGDTLFRNLRNAGIASVAASGNSATDGAISWPACSPLTVAVTSTATASDEFSTFGNVSAKTDLAAPGESIMAAITGSTYGSRSGTSMATPHVAGAFAVLRAKYPNATVREILTALRTTGVPVTRNTYTVPRISIPEALTELPKLNLSFERTVSSTPIGRNEKWSNTDTTGRVVGWTIDGDTRQPINIRVTVNGTTRATVSANRTRRDIQATHFNYGSAHGFDTTFTLPKGKSTVCVTAVNVGAGSNTNLGCREFSTPVK